MMKPEISIVGCGRVGTCLAVFLAEADYALAGLYNFPAGTASVTAQYAGRGIVYEKIEDAVAACDVVFLTTPDNCIETVCREIASKFEDMNGKTVFHCSGAHSSDILASAAAKGAATGSIHPLQSFAPYRTGQPSPFKGVNFCLEGEPSAVETGGQIINALGGRFFSIPTQAKILYHAAAVVASNYFVTLEHIALQLLEEAELSELQAFEILEPLITGTLKNIKSRGTVAALTGPVVRGDDETVTRHLEDIDKLKPEFSAFYRLMGKHTLAVARQQGTLSPSDADRLDALFKRE